MKLNPVALIKMKPKISAFKGRHPKFFSFLSSVTSSADVDSVIEIKLTTSSGKSSVTNLKLTPEDVELFKEVGSMLGK